MGVNPNGERGPSQTLRATLAIRELILEGALSGGERISELAVVERTSEADGSSCSSQCCRRA
jgi:DNA-binding GntR family transcriptional regulator